MERGGAAVVLPDAGLAPAALRGAVDAILLDPARLHRMAAASLALDVVVERELLRAAG